MGLVNKVPMVNKWKCKAYNILSTIQIRKPAQMKSMISSSLDWIEFIKCRILILGIRIIIEPIQLLLG
jgi:hypothetical protein